MANTPGPKGTVAGVRVSPPKPRCPQDHPACSRQLKVLSSLVSELGKSTRLSLHLDTNQACRRENASGRCGRRRRRSSQMISCNGIYRAKVRQGNDNDVTGRMVNGMPAVASKQGPTDHTGKADLSGTMQCGLLVRPWDTKMSGLLPRSSVVVTWKAGCGESRTSGLEWGKDREVLPITTGVAATPPPYPTRSRLGRPPFAEVSRAVRRQATDGTQQPTDSEQTRRLAYELYERELRTGTIERTQPPPPSRRETPPSAEG